MKMEETFCVHGCSGWVIPVDDDDKRSLRLVSKANRPIKESVYEQSGYRNERRMTGKLFYMHTQSLLFRAHPPIREDLNCESKIVPCQGDPKANNVEKDGQKYFQQYRAYMHYSAMCR